jgi:hypothetical protein
VPKIFSVCPVDKNKDGLLILKVWIPGVVTEEYEVHQSQQAQHARVEA